MNPFPSTLTMLSLLLVYVKLPASGWFKLAPIVVFSVKFKVITFCETMISVGICETITFTVAFEGLNLSFPGKVIVTFALPTFTARMFPSLSITIMSEVVV